MSGTVQMWRTPEGVVENFLVSELKTFFSQPSLRTVLAQEERELTSIQQHQAALIVENKALMKNFVKIAIIEKCIAENEKTREFLLNIIHLLTVAKKAYEAMGLPWSRMITLSDGPIGVFSEAFVDTKITPFLSELETIDPVGFTEFPELTQDKGMQTMMSYAIDQREKVIQKASKTGQCCAQFLAYRTSLNKIFAPKAYFQLRMNLSELLSDLKTILEDVHDATVFLFHHNNYYVNHTLPDFKEKVKARNIDERLKQNCARLEQCAKEVIIHEGSIQQLRTLIRGESLPYTLFFPVPKPAVNNAVNKNSISNDSQVEEAIPNPQKWARVKFGNGS